MTLKKAILLLQIIICVSFISFLMYYKEWGLAWFAVVLSSWIVTDNLKIWNK